MSEKAISTTLAAEAAEKASAAIELGLTPQQRAAVVTAAFYRRKSLRLSDVMRVAGLTRRAALDLLRSLSEEGVLPIAPVGRAHWILIDREWQASREILPPRYDTHPNTRALLAFVLAQGGQMAAGDAARLVGLLLPEARWLLEQLRESGLPIAEVAKDLWVVTGAAEQD